MKALRQRKAFTIVEMVIVIAVIAVLATVMIPTISGVIDKANVSVDQQLAASLNTQLAVWEADSQKTINSEEELIKVLGEFYDGDFYENLKPKSGDQGYSYWFDAETRRIILARSEDLRDPNFKLLESDSDLLPEILLLSAGMDDAGRAADDPYKFEPNSPRSLLIDTAKGPKNLFLLDKGGSELGEKIDALGKVTDRNDYQALILEIKTAADGGDLLLQAMLDKLYKTVVITEGGIFRFDAKDVKYAYVPEGVKTIKKNVDVYAYDPTAETVTFVRDNTRTIVDKSGDNWYNITIQLPKDVKVEMGALSGFYNENDDSATMTSTPTIYVKTTEDKLDDIFEAASTDCVIVLPTGDRYAIENNVIKNLSTGNSAGDLTVGSIESIGIQYNDGNSTPGADGGYFYNNNGTKTLYLAYDLGSAQLMLDDNLSASLVNWTVSDNAPITVDNNGKITITGAPNAQNATATVTASLKADPSKSDTIAVQLVFPTTVTVGYDGLGTPVNNQIAYAYDATQTVFNISKISVGYTQSGYAIMANEPEFKIELGEGNLFTQNGNTLTLVPTVIATQPTQELTVSYGDYWVKTYTITVTDNSSSPFSVNKIVNNECNDPNCEKRENCVHNDVMMGATYLFRVGNGNSFTLDKLFSCEKAPANITVKIYNAMDTTGTGGLGEIATSGEGFTASYTSALTNANWASSTIKFGGTGVAIIEVTTTKGTAKLAVEVVDGYNITDASQLKSNANNILLNDIKLASGGKFSLTGDAINHKVLYGNGFKFDITAGAKSGNGIINLNNADLDNVRIIGSVYTTYVTGSTKDYYSSAVYIGGSARISNSYIFGTKNNIFLAGGNLEVVDTVLECARFANVNIEGGTLIVDGLTTINEPNASNSNVVGLGIVFNDGAASSSKINVKGELKQYNWICEADESYLPGVSGLSTFVDTIFESTEFVHTIDGVEYANLGIICMDADVSVNNVSYPTTYSSKTISKLGQSGFVVSIRDDAYNATASDLTYRTNAYIWTPEKQANTVPTIKWDKYSNGSADVTFEKGQTGTFDPNVFSATKYGVKLTHTITANGTNYTGTTITFTNDQTCIITYTVTDGKIYNQNGVSTGNAATYTYTLTVNVTTTDPAQKEPEFKFTNSTGTKDVVYNGKTYKVPEFTDSSKFFNVGNGIYAPIVEVQFKDNSSDFTPYYPIFGGLSITWYNASGTATTYNTSSNLNALPSGLEWITSVASVKGGVNDWDGYAKYSSYGLSRVGKADGSTNSSDTYKTVEFSFQAEGCEKYYYYIRFKETAHTCPSGGGCVTGDTLVTLADGTQVRVDSLTGNELLRVWDHTTGTITYAPIAYIVNHDETISEHNVLKMAFSDGNYLEIIGEHVFYDKTLNKYVAITADNVDEYIGHAFVSNEGNDLKEVTLVGAENIVRNTGVYEVVTYKAITCFTNGILSASAYLDPLLNVFDMDADSMVYDEAKMMEDIATYGLYTYEDFEGLVPEEAFEMYNAAYLKIAVGKGYITWDNILELIDIYYNNDVTPLQ